VILCDDLGYGDLHSFGSSIDTPNLDRMGREGTRFTNAISANPVCSPSRASLLTGRYPTRVGVPRVIMPDDRSGLAKDETTLAELLQKKDYATGCLGKWHLGHQPDQMPTRRGFDSYFGIPYSNDMKPTLLFDNEKIVEQEADQDTLTRRYTERAVGFIEQNARRPFFLYLAHSFPHIPLHASEAFRGKSPLGIYGDVVNELDWSTGRVLNALRRNGLDSRTLVLFTSDNGPWYQGSPGASRGRKGATWEGGVRVPFLAWQPGSIPAGRTSRSLVSHLDVFPTVAARCGLSMPKPADGVDLWPLLTGKANAAERDVVLYFSDVHLQCIRRGDWKLHVARYNGWIYTPGMMARLKNLPLPNPELYNLALDPDESYDLAATHPDIVRELSARAAALLPGFPEPVRKAWTETRERKVRPTSTGAYPAEAAP
jgi:arylsulfatase